MRRVWIGLLALSLLTSPAVAGPNFAKATLDYYFNVEWQAASSKHGPVVEGYVYNKSALIADRMRIRVEQLDGSGNVVGTTDSWVLGGVPPSNRAWFQVRVPQAPSYRVEVLSFDWLGRGGGQ
jgi:hypothetical protein